MLVSNCNWTLAHYNNFGEIHNSQGLDWAFPSRPVIILSEPYLSVFC